MSIPGEGKELSRPGGIIRNVVCDRQYPSARTENSPVLTSSKFDFILFKCNTLIFLFFSLDRKEPV